MKLNTILLTSIITMASISAFASGSAIMDVNIMGPQTAMTCKIDSSIGIVHSTWTANGVALQNGNSFQLQPNKAVSLVGHGDSSGQEMQFHAYCGGNNTMLDSIQLTLLSMQTSTCDNTFLTDYKCSPASASGDNLNFTITKS